MKKNKIFYTFMTCVLKYSEKRITSRVIFLCIIYGDLTVEELGTKLDLPLFLEERRKEIEEKLVRF
ncbi:hypothetical protein COE15_23970 [Bacillus cereus]|nr:hypothetical protein CN288_15085 [Bacillus sp. AFS023182]PGX92442.1 hypothetical protein COE15_23970 [Bacillus cereus]